MPDLQSLRMKVTAGFAVQLGVRRLPTDRTVVGSNLIELTN